MSTMACKLVCRPRFAVAGLVIACAFALSFSSASAATITWGAATLISGDSDVVTSGTLVTAADIGTTGVDPTVNGVTFGGTATQGLSGGTASATGFGTAGGTFGALSDDYKELLQSGVFSFSTMTLTLNGLTIGHNYVFQTWMNDATVAGNGRTGNVVAGNSVTLDYNNTNAVGGVGQFVVGTFIADANSQAITYSGGSLLNQVNAYQLRDLTIVPEPSSFILLICSAFMLARIRAKRS
jgi:hypothetical protein